MMDLKHYLSADSSKRNVNTPNVCAIPHGSDPGEIIRNHRILGSAIEAVPMMRASFKAGQDFADSPRRAIVRVADDRELGTVGGMHTLIQPGAIADLLSLLHREVGLEFETAGLFEDETTFLTQAKIGEFDLGPLATEQRAKFDTKGRDILSGYVTFVDNFTGKRCATAGMAQTRMVCGNTGRMAAKESKKAALGRAIRHQGNPTEGLKEWQDAILEAANGFKRFVTFAQASRETFMPQAVAIEIIAELVPLPAKGASPAKAQAKRDAIFAGFDNGIGNTGKTAWDLYNGVTEWANWAAPVRGDYGSWDRLQSVLLNGLGDTIAEAEHHIRVHVGV
jgi:hypothetical protein